jgi:hypothetical protein
MMTATSTNLVLLVAAAVLFASNCSAETFSGELSCAAYTRSAAAFGLQDAGGTLATEDGLSSSRGIFAVCFTCAVVRIRIVGIAGAQPPPVLLVQLIHMISITPCMHSCMTTVYSSCLIRHYIACSSHQLHNRAHPVTHQCPEWCQLAPAMDCS